jgi:hypothetical protein
MAHDLSDLAGPATALLRVYNSRAAKLGRNNPSLYGLGFKHANDLARELRYMGLDAEVARVTDGPASRVNPGSLEHISGAYGTSHYIVYVEGYIFDPNLFDENAGYTSTMSPSAGTQTGVPISIESYVSNAFKEFSHPVILTLGHFGEVKQIVYPTTEQK